MEIAISSLQSMNTDPLSAWKQGLEMLIAVGAVGDIDNQFSPCMESVAHKS